jgi:hypothetical protein
VKAKYASWNDVIIKEFYVPPPLPPTNTAPNGRGQYSACKNRYSHDKMKFVFLKCNTRFMCCEISVFTAEERWLVYMFQKVVPNGH